VTDRGIRESKALDFKKLCVVEGEKVWLVFIDIYPINADGNMFDACYLATLAAIKDASFPILEDGKIDYKTKGKEKLPLTKLPISCTVWKVGNEFIVDPLHEEEEAADARISIVFMDDGRICAMQKGGSEALKPEEIFKMVDIAEEKTNEVRRHFK
jgi:exosome complex component RRP42